MRETFQKAGPVILLILFCVALTVGVTFFIQKMSTPPRLAVTETPAVTPLTPNSRDSYQVNITNNMNPIATMATNYGTIELELFEDFMPITAGNFIKLAESGFYNGVKFHRVIDGFMIQGGDPLTKTDEVLRYGTGGPGYTIPDEFVEGKYLTNTRGTIAMANSGPNTGGSQFFINLVDNTNLDYDKPPLTSQHPVFGRVVSGMDVVDKIGSVDTGAGSMPREDVVIESVTIRRP